MFNLFSSLLKGTSAFTHHRFPQTRQRPIYPWQLSPYCSIEFGLQNLLQKHWQTDFWCSYHHWYIKIKIGFIPTRRAGDNTRRTIDLIDLTRTKSPALILSLDAQKAFDRLSWPFMFAILLKYGFSGPFIQALQSLYSHRSSQVQLSSHLSPTFPLSNGTRQACPLSPLLFILSLEPLAAAIRNCPNVTGVYLRQREYKPSIFTDDVLLMLTRPHTSLPSLHNILRSFSAISGYKINAAKTEALPINITPLNSLKYLGVQLTASYSTLYQTKFPPFKEINSLLTHWTALPLSLLEL